MENAKPKYCHVMNSKAEQHTEYDVLLNIFENTS